VVNAGRSVVELRPAPVVLTVRDRHTGQPRDFTVSKLEHDGTYAAIAVVGADPENLEWFTDVIADPYVVVRDGSWTRVMRAREAVGVERQLWWQRAHAEGALRGALFSTLQIRVFCLEAPDLLVVEDALAVPVTEPPAIAPPAPEVAATEPPLPDVEPVLVEEPANSLDAWPPMPAVPLAFAAPELPPDGGRRGRRGLRRRRHARHRR
jgi:deazaflavin-dependent oxidoreductase (nitroreductase family)